SDFLGQVDRNYREGSLSPPCGGTAACHFNSVTCEGSSFLRFPSLTPVVGYLISPPRALSTPSSLPPCLDVVVLPGVGSSGRFQPPHNLPLGFTNEEGVYRDLSDPEPGTDCGNRCAPRVRYGGPGGSFFIVLHQPSRRDHVQQCAQHRRDPRPA